jgi:C-terminal processing protease CtpA/Prc
MRRSRCRAKAGACDRRDNPAATIVQRSEVWFATKPFRFTSDFRIKVSQATIESNAKRVALAPNDKEAISSKFAAAYAQHRLGDVFSFELPMAQPRAGVRFAGKVYLLINRHSYSNTVQVAALSQDYGFAAIVGEETSDLATTLGAMEQFTLPRTGIDVGFPKAHIIRVNGDTRPRGVIPDIAIETPVAQADVVAARVGNRAEVEFALS